LEALSAADLDGLLEVADVGPVVAEYLTGFFATAANQRVLDSLLAAGVAWPIIAARPEAQGPLLGQIWVVSGKLESQSRDQAEEALRALGARTAKSVSSKTSVLLAGPGAGSKLSKAESLGVEIVDEAEFLERLAQAQADT
ncbi:MAG: NAD-dependent DNA ligase LigA, partial [Congregibacter sp.]|nr:NAD-dependent DNA ligase LigA [Congregibacter sp.]